MSERELMMTEGAEVDRPLPVDEYCILALAASMPTAASRLEVLKSLCKSSQSFERIQRRQDEIELRLTARRMRLGLPERQGFASRPAS
jgi:hypothetical protein